MRARLILATSLVALTAAGAAAGGWRLLHPRDKLAQGQALAARGELRPALLALREAVLEHPDAAEPHFRLGVLDLVAADPVASEKELLAARDRGWPAQAVKLPLAEALLRQGRFTDLLHDFPVEPDGSPEAAGILVMRAQAEVGLRQWTMAAADAAQAQRLDPKLGQAALVSARVALSNGDTAGATTAAEQAVKLMPDSVEALALLGETRLTAGDQVGALAWFKAAAAAPAGSAGLRARVQIRRAELLVRTNDPTAMAAVDAVLQQQPKQPMAQFLKAVLQAEAKDWKAADTTLVSIGAPIGDLPGAAYLTALVKSKMDEPQQAIDAAERAVAQAPGNAVAARLLAALYLDNRQPRQAVATLARTIGSATADPATLLLLAQAYAAAGMKSEVQPTLDKIPAAGSGDPRELTQVAALQAAAGDAGRAERTLQHVLDVIPAVAMRETDENTAAASGAQTAVTVVMLALQAGNLDRAEAGVKELRELRGTNDVQATLLDGLVKMARMDLTGAKAAFEDALRLDPSSVPAHLDLARAQAQEGDGRAALATLQSLLDADPANTAAISGKADLLFALGRGSEAIETLEAGHLAARGNATLTAQLSDAYVRIGSAAKAIPMLDDAMGASNKPADDHDVVLLLSARVRAQEALGRPQDAIATARQVLALLPTNVALRVQVADKLGAQSDWKGAEKLLAEGLALQPGNTALVEASALAAAKDGGSAAGLARADQLLADPANAGLARVLKGNVLIGQHDYAGAAAAYEAKITPDGPVDVVIDAARARLAAGQADVARSLLRSWVTSHPDASEAWFALSTIDLSAGRTAEAKDELERGHAAQSTNPAVLNNYAWVLQQSGDLARARTFANQAWLLSPNPRVADTFGWILLASGDREGAIALLKQAAGALKGDPTIQQHLAAALAPAGLNPTVAARTATP
jgi:putative PEP-CTERM system TPR-repeat lipoprotein